MAQVFLKFETKIDTSYDHSSEIVIPMVSFCKQTEFMFRNSSQKIEGLTPAQLYNRTFSFAEVFVNVTFITSNYESHSIINFADEEENNSGIHYEKTISDWLVCFHFKYLHSKQLKYKQGTIYSFDLYHQNYETYLFIPYYLFLTSNVNYPDPEYDNWFSIIGNNFLFNK